MTSFQKSNASWDRLCDITTELFPQYGARPAAFAAACRLHPDLAAAAVDPMGSPVIPGSPVAVPTAQPAAIRPRDFGWGRIIEQLNGAAVENAPGAGPAREHAGSAKPWRQIINSIEGQS